MYLLLYFQSASKGPKLDAKEDHHSTVKDGKMNGIDKSPPKPVKHVSNNNI